MTSTKKIKAFSYEGKGSKGQKVVGNIEANTPGMAKALLRKQGITVIKMKAVRSSKVNKKSKGKIKSADITLCIRQLATMLTAGIPLVQALQAIIEGIEKVKLKETISKVKEDLESGISFSDALRRHPKEFDELVCSLIEAGEISGTLDRMLGRIAVYKEKNEYLKKKIKKALYYPAIVLIITAIVSAVLLLKVVPTFKDLFKGFGAELPAFTQLILNISDILQVYSIQVVIAIVTGIVLCNRTYKTNTNFHNAVQGAILKIPVIGAILRKAIIARFARTLSTTFAAGVPLTDALTAVAKSSGNIVFYNAIIQIRDNISAGQQMRKSVQDSGLFPNMVVQMIAIGEESGTLEQMLEKIATIFEQEVDTSVDGLTTLLEPIVMLILGVVVGSLVVAMYLPIFKMGSAI